MNSADDDDDFVQQPSTSKAANENRETEKEEL